MQDPSGPVRSFAFYWRLSPPGPRSPRGAVASLGRYPSPIECALGRRTEWAAWGGPGRGGPTRPTFPPLREDPVASVTATDEVLPAPAGYHPFRPTRHAPPRRGPWSNYRAPTRPSVSGWEGGRRSPPPWRDTTHLGTPRDALSGGFRLAPFSPLSWGHRFFFPGNGRRGRKDPLRGEKKARGAPS
ncbi:hypothetical protein TNIN_364221 [Trichonephila inaurata madagascariensis]|uniref:Uncharacterized protein n=1 Tax=Trichonephila inaurata madagascariensis TaxID=2747483 RepID=A0A8X6WXM5_9ARAC|nr:hypothetical protein TNIN_364221 [Trichonephila inaurata madagascariensis]